MAAGRALSIARKITDEVLFPAAMALRANGSLSLGVAARCSALAGPSVLDGQLARLRAELDAAGSGWRERRSSCWSSDPARPSGSTGRSC